MSGYGNPVIHIPFPGATDDDEKDPVWVAIRNPKHMSPGDMTPKQVALDADGKPVDNEAAMMAMYVVYARMILGWRVYDPSSITMDPENGTVSPMQLMSNPATPEKVAKLPIFIQTRLSEVIKEAVNPPSTSEKGGITKTSSSPGSQSTPEIGQVKQFPERSEILS